MDLQTISTIAGLLSLGVTILAGIVAAVYMGKNNAGKTADDAQQRAIAAMQSELTILRGRVEDVKRENSRLEHVIDTICGALKSKGIIITISGEMINIEVDEGKKSTVIRIQEQKDV